MFKPKWESHSLVFRVKHVPLYFTQRPATTTHSTIQRLAWPIASDHISHDLLDSGHQLVPVTVRDGVVLNPGVTAHAQVGHAGPVVVDDRQGRIYGKGKPLLPVLFADVVDADFEDSPWTQHYFGADL